MKFKKLYEEGLGRGADQDEQLEKVHLCLSSANEQLRTAQENFDHKTEDLRIEHSKEINQAKKEALEREQSMADRNENSLREMRSALEANI
jgi:uncharacterized protein (DUF3084 family)